MNLFKYLFLVGAILCGAFGMIAMLMSGDGGIWSWIAWFAYVPAFMLLNYVIEDYGLGAAYTLWAGGTVIVIALFVMLFGEAWGELLSSSQYGALALVCVGIVMLALTKPTR